MKKQNKLVLSVSDSPEGPSHVCEYAYEDSTPFIFKADHDNSVVAELVCGVAIHHNLHTDDVAVTVAEWVPNLHDPLRVYKGHTMYVILKPDLDGTEFDERWSWHKYVLYAILGKQRERKVQVETTLYMPVAGSPVVFHPPPSRGGMRPARPGDSEVIQRQHMTAWALTKCQEACPELPQRLHRTLLREWRLVTALNNSRSKVQVRHAVGAALRRASLDQLAASCPNGAGIVSARS